LAYAQSAGALAEAGRKSDANQLLERCDSMMNQENIPYGMVGRFQQHNQISMQMLYAAYKAGNKKLIEKISNSLKKDMQQQASYYQGLTDNRRDAMSSEEERNDNLLKGLMQMEQQFKLITMDTSNIEMTKMGPRATTDTGNMVAPTDTAKP
jgi:predicted S18 family serine protease